LKIEIRGNGNARATNTLVMPGLDHDLIRASINLRDKHFSKAMDRRVKPGDDELGTRKNTTQLAFGSRVTHLMPMSNDQIFPRSTARSRTAAGPIIDQDGRAIPLESLGPHSRGFRFEFGNAGPMFGNLTCEQRLARLDAVAKLLDIAFIVPGTKIRYGIDGLIGLIPVVGDVIATAFSLWLVREARALGAPWHITVRMLSNVAVQGVVGMVPVAGDAFDVMFRANIRNVRMLRRWMDKQPR
jgi:Domain of unknown function (DUF4112)